MAKKSSTNRQEHGDANRSVPSAGTWTTLAFVLGLAIYAVAFYGTALPGPTQSTGRLWRRIGFFPFAFLPDVLIEPWFGETGSFAILDRLPILTIALVVVFTGWAVGRVCLRLVSADRLLDRAERNLLATAVGLNLVSLYTLVVGLLGGLPYRAAFVVPMAIAVLAALWTQRKRIESSEMEAGSLSLSQSVRSHWPWLAMPFALFIVLAGMLPPVDFDVREYHLEAPKEFYLNGRIGFLPHNVYGNMALGSEMHSLLGMVLLGDWWRGALVGKTVQSLFAVLTAFALFTAGRRWYSDRIGGSAAIIYLSTPWTVLVSTTGLVEGAVAFYLLTSVYAFLRWREAESQRQPGARGLLIVCGFLAGSAVATKYPAALFVALPLAVATAVVSRPHVVRPLAVLLVAMAVACSPWFVKNWAFTGNPTYPLLYGVFGGTTRTEANNAQWEAAHQPSHYTSPALYRSMVDILLNSEWLSPLVWPLALTAVFGLRDRRLRWLLVYVAYALAAWWLFTHRIDRFWIPLISVLALASGASTLWVYARAPGQPSGAIGWARRAAFTLYVAVGLLYCGVVALSGVLTYNRLFVPLAELRVDPQRVTACHRWLNEHALRDQQVLSVGDAQVFDLEMPVRYNTVFDNSIFEAIVRSPSGELLPADEIRKRLRNVSLVYVDWAEIARYRSPGNYGFSDFVQPAVFDQLVDEGVLGSPVVQFDDRAVRIYPVKSE